MSESEPAASVLISHSLIVKIVCGIVGTAATAYFAHREVAQKELTKAQARWDTETAELIFRQLDRIGAALKRKP